MTKLVSIVLTLMLGAGFTAAAVVVNGAGATFPYPIYSKWFDEFHKKYKFWTEQLTPFGFKW